MEYLGFFCALFLLSMKSLTHYNLNVQKSRKIIFARTYVSLGHDRSVVSNAQSLVERSLQGFVSDPVNAYSTIKTCSVASSVMSRGPGNVSFTDRLTSYKVKRELLVVNNKGYSRQDKRVQRKYFHSISSPSDYFSCLPLC